MDAPGSVARNRLCSCGSGRRYKHCCGRLVASAVEDDAIQRTVDAAWVQFHAGKTNAAEELCRQVLEAVPAEPRCLSLLGLIRCREGRLEEGLGLIHTAVRAPELRAKGLREELEHAVATVAVDEATRPIDLDPRYRGLLRGLLVTGSEQHVLDEAPRARVLVMSVGEPLPDRDSGSVRMTAILGLLLDLGCEVTFLPAIRQLAWASWVQRYGLGVIGPPAPWTPAQAIALLGRDFDVVLLSHFNMVLHYAGLVRRHAPGALLVFDTIDLHHLREQRRAETTGESETLRIAALTRGCELAAARTADVTLVVSEAERTLLSQEVPGAAVRVLSNVVPLRGRKVDFAGRRDIVFIGWYGHAPNVDAVTWYAKEVWPLVRARLPDARTLLVGSDMPQAVEALAADGIVAVGYVADLEPLLDSVRISVAPLRYGAGVKGKISLAQSSGVPVVATTLAAEGMHLCHGRDVLLADDAATFADAVVVAYSDAELWRRLSDGGMVNVSSHYGRERAGAVLEELLTLALARRQHAPAGTARAPAATRGAVRDGAILLVAPAAYGSLGDDAMARGYLHALQKHDRDRPVDLLSIYDGERWPALPGVRNVVTLTPTASGGDGRVLERVASILPRYERLALLGADVLDGYYSVEESQQRLRMVDLAARAGLDTRILGFSICACPDETVMAELAAVSRRTRLYVRDAVSLRRLAERGVENLVRVADIAFLLPPAPCSSACERAERWIDGERRNGRVVVGFNISGPVLDEAERSGMAILPELADFIATLIAERRASVVFIPHDLRRQRRLERDDVSLAVSLLRLAANRAEERRCHVFVPATAEEAKRVVGCVDVVATGRMHLAIAAWGMGRPTLAIGYQGKFEGLARDFGASDYLIESVDFTVERFGRSFFDLLDRREDAAAAVRARVEGVVELARMNVAFE